MNNKLKFLVGIFLIFIAQIAFCADYFSMGRNAYMKKDYALARTNFVNAIKSNPNDATYRYYYAQTLVYLKEYASARTQYGYAIQLAPNSQVAQYSKQAIDYINTQKSTSSKTTQHTTNTKVSSKTNPQQNVSTSGNYIKNAISANGGVTLWDKSRMPLKIYVDNSAKVSVNYINQAKNALYEWQSVGNGKFSFVYTNKPEVADVTIVFGKKSTGDFGLSKSTNLGGKRNKTTVYLYTINSITGKPLTPIDVHNVALHEFGHMLGINGHSPSPNDILYPTYDYQKYFKTPLKLTSRDINTMLTLYNMDLDPNSNSDNSITTLLGSEQERHNTAINNELNYIKNVPNNPLGYINAAKSLEANGDSKTAIAYYNKALTLDPANKTAMESLGRIYFQNNDYKNAEIYINKVISKDPKNIDMYCNLTKLYLKKGDRLKAKSTLNTLVSRVPQSKQNLTVKALMKQASQIK